MVVGLVPKSCPTLVTPWTIVLQAPLSMGFSRQEYWSGLPFSSPGDLPNPGIEPWSPALQEDSSPLESPGKPQRNDYTQLEILIPISISEQLAFRFVGGIKKKYGFSVHTTL